MAALFGAALLCIPAVPTAAISRPMILETEIMPLVVHDLPTRFAVSNEEVVVVAPSGYCVDLSGSRNERQGAFVLLAPCRSLTGNPSNPLPRAAGLLTASIEGSIGPRSFPSDVEFANLFNSARGRALLSNDGDPEGVSILQHFADNGGYYVQTRERTGGSVLDGRSWRMFFEVNGRMVTVTLREYPDNPIPEDSGRRTIREFARQITEQSPNNF